MKTDRSIVDYCVLYYNVEARGCQKTVETVLLGMPVFLRRVLAGFSDWPTHLYAPLQTATQTSSIAWDLLYYNILCCHNILYYDTYIYIYIYTCTYIYICIYTYIYVGDLEFHDIEGPNRIPPTSDKSLLSEEVPCKPAVLNRLSKLCVEQVFAKHQAGEHRYSSY